MPNIRQTTIDKDGQTVVVKEYHTNQPPTGQKRKEANQTTLLPAQPPSKTPKSSPTNQQSKVANVVGEKEKAKLCSVENCSETATVWPFVNCARASRRVVGYCDKCNVARKKEQSSQR